MKLLKVLAALIAVVVGISGITLSVAAVVRTWETAERLGRGVPQGIADVSTALDAVREQGELAAQVMRRSRDRLDALQLAVKELSENAEAGDEQALLDTLDAEIARRLGRAEGFVRSMQGSLQSTSSALLVLDSIPFLGSRKLKPDAQDKSDLKNLASSMGEMSESLEQLSATLAEIRTARRVDPQQAQRMEQALGRVGGELQRIESEITDFTNRMQRVSRDLSKMKDTFSQHLNTVALVLTAFFVCFAFSQVSLLCQGLRLLRGTRPAQE